MIAPMIADHVGGRTGTTAFKPPVIKIATIDHVMGDDVRPFIRLLLLINSTLCAGGVLGRTPDGERTFNHESTCTKVKIIDMNRVCYLVEFLTEGVERAIPSAKG